jgi:hypothetical protein
MSASAAASETPGFNRPKARNGQSSRDSKNAG